MASRINCEDAPECGHWSRKHHRFAKLKPCDVEILFEDARLNRSWQHSDVAAGCTISKIQDPNMDDEVALQLAMLHSQEKAAPYQVDSCIDGQADELLDLG